MNDGPDQGKWMAGAIDSVVNTAIDLGQGMGAPGPQEMIDELKSPMQRLVPYHDGTRDAAGFAMMFAGPMLPEFAAGGRMRNVGEFGQAGKVGEAATSVGRGTDFANWGGEFLDDSVRFGGGATHYERAEAMLARNIGYNVTPEHVFQQYSQVGRSGTFVTDYQAISDAAGNLAANRAYTVELFQDSVANTVSWRQAQQLETVLGLDVGSLSEGFRITEVPGLQNLNPRPPTFGNQFYRPGQGLPGGGPEMIVKPIPTASWPPR